jgi:hypothetical protein
MLLLNQLRIKELNRLQSQDYQFKRNPPLLLEVKKQLQLQINQHQHLLDPKLLNQARNLQPVSHHLLQELNKEGQL